ncbi:hypothetical protein ACW2QC_09165 [Virgibacillus sp. FSP13]
MTVRELIGSLLDYDMETEIEVELNLNNNTEWGSFEIEEESLARRVYLSIDLSNQVLIEPDRLEELEEAEENLKELEGDGE